MPRLRWLVTCHLQWRPRPRFNPMPVHVAFVVNQVGMILFHVLQFSCYHHSTLFIVVHSLITDIQSPQLMALITFSVLSSQFLNITRLLLNLNTHSAPFCFIINFHIGQSTNFPRSYKSPQNSRCQKGDMKHVPYWGYINIRCHHTEFPRWPVSHDMCTPVYTNNTHPHNFIS